MRIVVRLFAGLRERAGKERLVLQDLPRGLDVAQLRRVLAERHPELGDLTSARGVLDTRWVPDGTPLEDGQELSLLPPVSGGSGGPGEDAALAAGVFEIRERALDPAEVQRRLTHASCGALVLFTGTTRATSRGKDVERLDYEAFAAMAGAEMERIFAECRALQGPASAEGGSPPAERELRMLVLHRTGSVAIGEPSVVIGVASPHRDAAFRACRFLIDELKTRVPLWKKEVYRDGHHWIGERS
jgi:molybdopterin synthase catalytic subunit/molybdopterin converting factor small subunit